MKREILEIIRGEGDIKARVLDNGYTVSLLTMQNGYQWSGASISPELARLSIEVLREYLKEVSKKPEEIPEFEGTNAALDELSIKS